MQFLTHFTMYRTYCTKCPIIFQCSRTQSISMNWSHTENGLPIVNTGIYYILRITYKCNFICYYNGTMIITTVQKKLCFLKEKPKLWGKMCRSTQAPSGAWWFFCFLPSWRKSVYPCQEIQGAVMKDLSGIVKVENVPRKNPILFTYFICTRLDDWSGYSYNLLCEHSQLLRWPA